MKLKYITIETRIYSSPILDLSICLLLTDMDRFKMNRTRIGPLLVISWIGFVYSIPFTTFVHLIQTL